MAGENLWYLKRNDVVTGPFPQAMLERNMILGRVTRDDLIRQDRNQWVAAGRTVEFKTVYIAPLDSSVFVEADERQTERRNKTKDTQAEKLRLRRADRRVVEPDLLHNRRSRSYQIWRASTKLRQNKSSAVWGWCWHSS